MSNKPDKEAILKSLWDFESDPGRFSLAEAIIFPAMELFSASQNSELKKENENLKQDAAKMYSSLRDKSFQLEKENEELRKRIAYLENHTKYCLELDLEEKDKEIERLKKLAISLWHPAGGYLEGELQLFKIENNL